MSRTPERYRVQLDFTAEAFTELEKLKGDVEASSRADTIRYAMRVLRWVINTLRNGDQIVVRRRNEMVEVEFPFLAQEHRTQSEPAARTRTARAPGGDWVARGGEFVDAGAESPKDAGREAYRRASPEERT